MCAQQPPYETQNDRETDMMKSDWRCEKGNKV